MGVWGYFSWNRGWSRDHRLRNILCCWVRQKFRQKSNCVTCRDALGCTFQDVQENLSNLITTKTRGRLTYPNVHLYRLLHAAEDYFSTHAKSTHVYEATIDHVLETHNLSFPCEVHKQETLAGILHYYVLMRMRQFCSQENRATQKASREKKKQAVHLCTWWILRWKEWWTSPLY